MHEDCLHKDTFDEAIKRIELLVEANTNIMRQHQNIADAQHERTLAEIRGEIKELRAVVDGYGDTLSVAVEGIINKRTSFTGALSFVMAAAGVIIAAVQVYAVLFK